jgi:hypothetical protein
MWGRNGVRLHLIYGPEMLCDHRASKLSLCTTYRHLEEQLHSFLNSAPDGDLCASAKEKSHQQPLNRRLGARVGLDTFEKR